MTSTWLTWKMNRFEILFVLALAALLGVTAWVLADQIRSLGLTDAACWPRTEDGGYATPACDTLMDSFWPLAGQAGLIRVGLAIAPGVLGLILGVPIVARELEMRTAVFSWALAPSRWRWLLARFLPMLLVAVVALGVIAWAGTTLYEALWLGRYAPDLTEVSALGFSLVARGLAAVAVAMLVGVMIGRTMPALLTGVLVLGAWGLVVVPQAQNVLAEQRSHWQREDQDSSRTGDPMLSYTDYAFFDPSRPGAPGEPGLRVDQDAAWEAIDAQVLASCGQAPADETGESPEYKTWTACSDPIFSEAQAHVVQATKAVPRTAWGDFVVLDVTMSALLGAGALLLSFPFVARRKPG
jgi:hypothetical protein